MILGVLICVVVLLIGGLFFAWWATSEEDDYDEYDHSWKNTKDVVGTDSWNRDVVPPEVWEAKKQPLDYDVTVQPPPPNPPEMFGSGVTKKSYYVENQEHAPKVTITTTEHPVKETKKSTKRPKNPKPKQEKPKRSKKSKS